MVNPVVDGYTKTLFCRKIVRKIQKNNNLINQKNTETKKCVEWVRFSHLACQGGGQFAPMPPSVSHWLLYIVFTYSKLSQVNCNNRYEMVA